MVANRNDYPRVTTVLHEGLAEGGLDVWAVKVAMLKLKKLTDAGMPLDEAIQESKRASREIMEIAARRGTAAHTAIEKGEMPPVSDEDRLSVQTCYDSFLLWAKERNFQALAHEVPIWSDKHGYKGTLDCVGYVDGRLELIDWKTSNSIRIGYRAQTAAYWYGLKESKTETRAAEIDTDGLQGIRIVRFGGRSDKESHIKDLVEYEELIVDGEAEVAIDFNAFLAAKRIYDWKLKRK